MAMASMETIGHQGLPQMEQSVNNGHFPLHHGEEGAGTEHPATSGMGEGTLAMDWTCVSSGSGSSR